MVINLTDIFKEQVKLDHNIHQNHNVTYQTVIEEIKLALLVELGELANEVRCFKFWSNKGPSDKITILEEYVDGIHFITSMCIRENIEGIFEIREMSKNTNKKDITKLFNDLFDLSNKLSARQDIIHWYQLFLELGYVLGFNLNDIKDAYINKNKVNHQRQLDNY